MKNLIKVFGIITLVAIIGFSFAACGGDGGGGGGNNPQTETYTGTSGGTTYTLKIIQNTARYTAQNGDNYVLTGGSKTSNGMVFSFANGVLTLIPSNAPTAQFTVAVSGNSITAINNTITWTDNTTATVPGEFTGGTTPGTNPGTGSGGTFTVTNIPAKYNGKYASFSASINGGTDTAVTLASYQSVSGIGTGDGAFINSTLSRISNGSVSSPAWLVNADNTVVRYSGNDTFDVFAIGIYEAGTVRENALAGTSNTLVMGVFRSVTFTNGSATVSRNNALNWNEYK